MSTHTKIGSLMEAWLQEQQRTSGETVEALDTLLDRSQAELSAFLGKFNSVGAFRHFDWSEEGVEMLQPPTSDQSSTRTSRPGALRARSWSTRQETPFSTSGSSWRASWVAWCVAGGLWWTAACERTTAGPAAIHA